MTHIIREMNQAYAEVVRNQQYLKEEVGVTKKKKLKPSATTSMPMSKQMKDAGGVRNAVRKAAGLKPTEFDDFSDDNERNKEDREKAMRRAAKMIAVMKQNQMGGILQGDQELTKEEFYYAVAVLRKEGLAESNQEALHLIDVFESTDTRLVNYLFD